MLINFWLTVYLLDLFQENISTPEPADITEDDHYSSEHTSIFIFYFISNTFKYQLIYRLGNKYLKKL